MAEQVDFRPDDDAPIYVISVAASLAGMHAQTLRQYDRLGLVIPSRTRGGGRRYSGRDVALLREVQRLSQDEGISLAGIQRILTLEDQVSALQSRVRELRTELDETRAAAGQPSRRSRVFAVGPAGDVTPVRPGRPPAGDAGALVLWRPAQPTDPAPH
jgi:MerR family transcriptional regulator/heat shock protein HspR